MGYLVQMAGLAVQNFLSAATGIVVAIALIRGFARHTRAGDWQFLGGHHALDALRAAAAGRRAGAGARQPGRDPELRRLQGRHDRRDDRLRDAEAGCRWQCGQGCCRQCRDRKRDTQTQTLPMGPVASQESIKELGTNGGGFFNANSSHPYENPTPLTNLLEIVAILLIPFALTYTFGKMVGDTRQGWAILAAMLILLTSMILVAYYSEQHGNPLVAAQGIDQVASATQPGGNMEGKETRFGIAASAVFAAVTTATSCGAVNIDARLDDATRGLRAAVPDAAGRGCARRGGHRPVLDPDLCHPRRIHCRSHDRPDAGIPWQEDRSHRDEACLDLHPHDSIHRAHRDGRRDQRCRGQGGRPEPRRPRLQRDPLRIHIGRKQ